MAEPLDRDMPLALVPPSHAENASLAMVEAAEPRHTFGNTQLLPCEDPWRTSDCVVVFVDVVAALAAAPNVAAVPASSWHIDTVAAFAAVSVDPFAAELELEALVSAFVA